MIQHAGCLPATLVAVDDDLPLVRFGDTDDAQAEPATWALAAPVVLAAGARVLCVRDDAGQCFIIAPIGRPAEWQLQAQRIEIEAADLRLQGDRLELAARRLFEKTIDAYRWTRDLLQWCCGRQRTLVDGQQQTRAGRIDQRAEGHVTIDGEQINLG